MSVNQKAPRKVMKTRLTTALSNSKVMLYGVKMASTTSIRMLVTSNAHLFLASGCMTRASRRFFLCVASRIPCLSKITSRSHSRAASRSELPECGPFHSAPMSSSSLHRMSLGHIDDQPVGSRASPRLVVLTDDGLGASGSSPLLPWTSRFITSAKLSFFASSPSMKLKRRSSCGGVTEPLSKPTERRRFRIGSSARNEPRA
mmetsp:Transcript_8353/g.14970  ORF Transcript_8353/g.14970 Transcript_8353/m.14970 type:complete len:202 (-) Transcript_8353:130-735(-)